MGKLMNSVLAALGRHRDIEAVELPEGAEEEMNAAFSQEEPDEEEAGQPEEASEEQEAEGVEEDLESQVAGDDEDLDGDGQIEKYEHSFGELADQLESKGYTQDNGASEATLVRQLGEAIDADDWQTASLKWTQLRPFLGHPSFGPALAASMNGNVFMALERGGKQKPEPIIGRLGEPTQQQTQGKKPANGKKKDTSAEDNQQQGQQWG